MKGIFSKFYLLVLMLMLYGCSSLPGSYLNTGNIFISDAPIIKITEINPELIKLLNKEAIKEDIQQKKFDYSTILSGYKYRVGPGDILNVTVWDHPELTIPAGQYRSAGESGNIIHPDGSIFYPYIGRIQVLGMHVSEIRDVITNDLSEYIEKPQVDVSVASYNSKKVFVSGSVNQPTILPITNIPLTILDAISEAGGLRDDADWKSITLSRTINNEVKTEIIDFNQLLQKGDFNQNRLLIEGDVIHVPKNDNLKVFVMGNVIKQDTQIINRNGLSLAEALSNAGIDDATVNKSGIFILRASENDSTDVTIYKLDANITTRLVMSTQFQLKPLDIIYVTSAPVARWNILISQLVPTVRSLYELNKIDQSQD